MCVVRGRSSRPAPKSWTQSTTSTARRAPIACVRNVLAKRPRASGQSEQVVAIAQAVGSRFLDDLPSKSQIFDCWKDRLPEFGFRIHWREPCCWACGYNYGARFRIKQSDVGSHEISRCWDNIPLQRCHIIPRSLGGTNEVTNLFLMCRECHDLAPNTSIPEVFFEWARGQDWDARESAKILAALQSFGVDSMDYRKFNEVLTSQAFASWWSTKFGLHRPQSNYASISSRLTPATLVGLVVYYQRLLDADRRNQSSSAGLTPAATITTPRQASARSPRSN